MKKTSKFLICFFVFSVCSVCAFLLSDNFADTDVAVYESSQYSNEVESESAVIQFEEKNDNAIPLQETNVADERKSTTENTVTEIITNEEKVISEETEISEETVTSEPQSKNPVEITPECSTETDVISSAEYSFVPETEDEEDVISEQISDDIISSSVSSRKSESYKTFGTTYSGTLSDSDDSEEYSFYVQERGYISFVLSHESFTGTGGWLVTVESEYYTNGIGGTTAFRKISSLICESDRTKHSSVNIGVIPGNYRIKVVPYIKTVTSKFSICVSFTANSDYEIECNDTQSRYTDFYPGKTICGTASFSDSTDTDWYMFRMYSDGVIKLTFEHSVVDVASALWKVIMYDSNGSELYAENSYGSSKMIDSGCIGLSAGVYYIKIQSRVYSRVVYSLSAERVTSGKYEHEINDSIKTATACSLNETVYGNSASRQSSADKDFFKFTVKKSGIAVLTFAHDEIKADDDKKAWNVTLTDSSGNILYFTEAYYFRTKIVSPSVGLPAGTYYVCIDCDNCYRADADYSVLFTFKKNSAYETEINNTHAKADSISEGSIISGNLSRGKSDYDKDCYLLTIKNTGKVDISFSHKIVSSDRAYYRISLYDSKGNKVTFYTSDGQMCDGTVLCYADNKTLTLSTELSEGKYYLDISVGDYYSDSTYTLTYKETVY